MALLDHNELILEKDKQFHLETFLFVKYCIIPIRGDTERGRLCCDFVWWVIKCAWTGAALGAMWKTLVIIWELNLFGTALLIGIVW